MSVAGTRVTMAVCLCLLLRGGLYGQIKSGKSDFWANLEAGVPQVFTPMGTSVSQTKNSYWPGELTNQLREKYGDAFSIEGAYTARQGHTSANGIDQTLSTVIGKNPDAVTVEYSIMDSHPERGVSLQEAENNLKHIVDQLRAQCPGVEIFLWKSAYPRDPTYQARPNLDAYYDLMEKVAIDKQTYYVNTYDSFKAIYDSLAAIGREDEYITWIYDTHHPSLYAASHLIVPAMIGAFSGEPVEGMGTALSVSSLEGRVFYVGEELSIDWVHDPQRIDGVSVAVSLDGGRLYTTLTSSPLTAPPFVWPIPPSLNGRSTITDSAVVRLTDTDAFYSGNTRAFSIEPADDKPTLALLPLDKTTYTIGDTLAIQWRYDPNKLTSFDVELSFDGGRTYHLLNKEAAVESDHYDWLITETLDGVSTSSVEVIVKLSDYGETHEDLSNPFAIRIRSPHELFIDNADASASAVGEWPASDGQSGYYGESYQHDKNEGKGAKEFIFSATVPEPGLYELFMRWTAHINRASNVPVIIEHRDGVSPVVVNQRVNGSRWNVLGTFNFSDNVAVTVRTTGTNGFVVADAVRLLQVGPPTAGTASRGGTIRPSPAQRVTIRGNRLVVPGGAHRVRVFDCKGATVFSRQLGGSSCASVALPKAAGLRIIAVDSPDGRTVMRLPATGAGTGR